MITHGTVVRSRLYVDFGVLSALFAFFPLEKRAEVSNLVVEFFGVFRCRSPPTGHPNFRFLPFSASPNSFAAL